MLSIVKMDVDCDSESLDGEIHIKEEIPVKEEPFYIEDTDEVTANSGLNLIPLVYTTRLDDMVIINSNTNKLHPKEVTAKILEESKPKLRTFPNDNYSLSNKRTFNAMKTKLKKIYQKNINLENSSIQLDFPDPIIDPDSIKCEVQEDSIVASKSTEIDADPLIKCEAFDEHIIRACKYSELLKLCRPCSVVLPILHGYDSIGKDTVQNNEIIIPPKFIIKKFATETKQHQNVPVNIASCSNKEPLITLDSNSMSQLESRDSGLTYGVNTNTKDLKVSKPCYGLAFDENYEKKFVASFNNQILSDGVLMVAELYSHEYSIYCTDKKGCLTEYYKEKDGNGPNKKHVSVSRSNYFPVKSCCWVQRDGIIQSLYPKILLCSNARFMRKPHTCPPGACKCCCQKARGIYDKPDIKCAGDAFSKEDIEIYALEKEIRSSIIKMNKESGVSPSSILRKLLKHPKSLIDKALMYKKPLPKKPKDNRRLDSLKLDNSQASVIVLRNFAADEREIYELSPDGELKSYIKLTCFKNTDRTDVKKLLQKTKEVSDVCCWFRRENLITKLIDSKTLHPSAVKFIRTRHKCAGDECSCCCKPADAKDVTLTDIKFPARPSYWPELLNRITGPPKPPTWLDNYVINPASSGMSTPTLSPLPASTKPIRVASKPLPKNMPITNNYDIRGTQAPPLDNQDIKPSTSLAGTSTTPMIDDDCQFIGVRTAPTLGHESPLINSVRTEQPNDQTNELVGEISEEVNTLITSILDRFKDVRLTINSDGKVAAALNTPVSNLTTVELKVLANILSYAQSQVNSLGLNSSMSLSNIINLRVGDSQSVTSVDPASVYKAFGDNVDINNQSQATHVNKSLSTVTANAVPKPNNFPNLSNALNTNDMPNFFTNSMYEKHKEYTDSFNSLLSTKLDAEPSTDSIPVIQNVFSLKDQISTTANETSTTTVFCRTPASQNQRPGTSTTNMNTQKVNETSNKRTPANADVTPPVTKKIRVLSPSKLHGSTPDNLNAMVSSVSQPLTTPALQTRALEVNGLRSGVPLLSNNNFRVVPVRPRAPLVTKPRIIRMNNFRALSNPSLTLTQPSIVVAPLQVSSGIVVQNLPTMGTLFPVVAVGTSTQAAEIEIKEEPIKMEQDFNEDDDNCILGV